MGFTEDRASGRFGPFYFLIAENLYVLWDAVENWKRAWQPAAAGQAGPVPHVFTAPQIDHDRLRNLIATVPLFETLQLVVIQDVERVHEKRQDEVGRILRNLPATTKILLTSSEIDRRKTWYKTLASLGPVEVFPRIYPEGIAGWVRRIASDFGWTLSPPAVDLIASVHGTDLFAARQTIERATLFIGRQRRIELADIEIVIAADGEHDVYLLVEALSGGDLARALEIVRSLTGGPSDRSTFLLGQMTTQTQKLLALLECGKMSEDGAAKALGMHPFLVRKLRPQAAAFGVNGLADMAGAVFETDWAIKTSTVKPEMAMQLLAWRLSSPARRETVWFDLEDPITRE
jgi:DNA polymerase-3 subunit delta